MSTIVISPSNVVTFPEGGGHFWVYLQYVRGFLSLGCDLYWLERFVSTGNKDRDDELLRIFLSRMELFGLQGKTILYTVDYSSSDGDPILNFIKPTDSACRQIFQRADLLLNFYYAIDPLLLNRFKHTAMVDIDPGLLQFWISTGQLRVHSHDYYLTIGETVGTPSAKFPDCGFSWKRIRPPVCLESWPYHFDQNSEAFSTISSWWGGGGKGEFITDGKGILYENNKRVTFLQYASLPKHIRQPLELALNLGEGDEDEEDSGDSQKADKKSSVEGVTDYISDAVDKSILLKNGWKLKNAYEVAGTPQLYQAFIQSSRGEFSCVKPSCINFQNAWVSDRTICYLASGKPVVVQDTGPSNYLPDGDGMFRFSSIEEATEAFSIINSNYKKQCIRAREIAVEFFDAKKIAEKILDCCQI